MLAGGLLGAILVIGGGYWFLNRPRSSSLATGGPGRDGVTGQRASSYTEFATELDLPGSPMGAASNGREIVVGNRKDPWGVIRLRRNGEQFAAERIPVIESRYSQKISLNSLTWNGENYVGLTTGSWFGIKDTDVFTVHDAATLQVIRHHVAPPLLGCVAWDGSSYWAATRRNTAQADEKVFLYRLDREFNVTATFDPPAVGCQGLLWDGTRLWFADVFSDSVYLIDVSHGQPRLLHTAHLPFGYLSGIVLHDGSIWIAQYDNDHLYRLRSATRMAWSGERDAVETALASAIPAGAGTGDEAVLRQKLRAEDWSERMRAKMELDSRGAAIDYARDQNNFVDREPEDTEDIDWSIELRDDAVWLDSSRIWFGPDLFLKHEPQSTVVSMPEFAKYTFTVKQPDGTETTKEFEASAGENVLSSVRLAEATSSGTYSVSLFIHVQYVDANGTSRILNNSAGSLDLRR